MIDINAKLLDKIHEQFADEVLFDEDRKLHDAVLERFPNAEHMFKDNPYEDNEDANALKTSCAYICGYFSEDEDIQAAVTFYKSILKKYEHEDTSEKDKKYYKKLYLLMEPYFIDAAEAILENEYEKYAEFRDKKVEEHKKKYAGRGRKKKQD